ncbi:MAG: phosphoribosylformylglycinamidine synthase subunit PurL [Robiginitomaculum sp.]|nr:phosphoribosylformylglycinamidine synthase subunit PurL [Robiginitomaculum sp.]
MSEGVEITAEIIAEHGLNPEEYNILLQQLGRTPNLNELGICSVMWSEHCSYKSSRIHLAKFPTTGKKVICGPGENAGVIDIGDGDAVIFKMESHNHPSFIEPYQGAATGVGGIMRDVFTMGARPIALLNALRFGEPGHYKTRSLVAGVVAGIGGYGNCVGVPTVGGEINFDAGYNGNILVNAMCVGLAKTDSIFYSAAKGVGNSILYVGARTGRDGIHGATMASAEFDDDAEEKRPTVQVGDPFTEKRLIEACLELMATGNIIAIQDMGAAGLTSSSIEMADKGGVGIEIDLDRVPQRENNMSAYEMMLSESQERMLIVLKPGTEAESRKIFTKWELDVDIIGKTTDTGRLVLQHQGEMVCDLPIAPLSDMAPKYDRPWVKTAKAPRLDAGTLPQRDPIDVLCRLMASPDMVSKRWVWEQYDRHVMGDTLMASASGCDAAIVRIRDSEKALAISSDCTPRYVQADPYRGGKQAVAESWRNLIAAGAKPIAITDCLNFGNPERPEIMGQLVQAIEGMSKACKKLSYPVVSGNVSLYNETKGSAIPPTPTVGGVGIIKDISMAIGFSSARQGDMLVLVGRTRGWLGSSIYAREIENLIGHRPPPVSLSTELQNGKFVRKAIKKSLLRAVHDLSDGGLACAAVDMAMASNVGIVLDPHSTLPDNAWYFGEDQARYLLSIDAANYNKLQQLSVKKGVLLSYVGEVKGDDIRLGSARIRLSDLQIKWEQWFPEFMEKIDANAGK